MRTEDLKKRTKEFVIRVIKLVNALPKKKLDSLLKEANELTVIFSGFKPNITASEVNMY